MPKWESEDIELLKKSAANYTVSQLSSLLGRTRQSIYQQCANLNISVKKARRGPKPDGVVEEYPETVRYIRPDTWTVEDDANLTEWSRDHTIVQLSEKLNRSRRSIHHRLQKLGLEWVDGRTTTNFAELQSSKAKRREPKLRFVEESPGTMKACLGKLHNGEERPVEEFEWTGSGLSRKQNCIACNRYDATLRVQASRDRRRGPDWKPTKVPRVECSEAGHRCTSCRILKQHADFYADMSSPCGYASQCKECRTQDRRDRWDEDRNGSRTRDFVRRAARTPEEIEARRDYDANYNLQRRHGILREDKEYIRKLQNDVCALCNKPESYIHPISGELSDLCVDHFHGCENGCGRNNSCCDCIRGLLCHDCNQALGVFEKRGVAHLYFPEYLSRRPLRDRE